MRGERCTYDPPPSFREDGAVRLVVPGYAGKNELATTFYTSQDISCRRREGPDGRTGLCVREPQTGIIKIDLGPFKVHDLRTAAAREREKANTRYDLPMLTTLLCPLQLKSQGTIISCRQPQRTSLIGRELCVNLGDDG